MACCSAVTNRHQTAVTSEPLVAIELASSNNLVMGEMVAALGMLELALGVVGLDTDMRDAADTRLKTVLSEYTEGRPCAPPFAAGPATGRGSAVPVVSGTSE